MEELRKQLDELRLKQKETEELLNKMSWEITDLENKIIEEDQKDFEVMIPNYTAKLERLKVFTDGFISEHPRRGEVKYAFKRYGDSCYTDDFHQPMHDPLEWTIAEYNLIGMSDYIEILFYYTKDGLKHFINNWMKENIPYSEFNFPEEFFRIKETKH